MKVFFLHGLESRPNGSKVRLLREQGFEVIAPDLHMGTSQMQRRNSVVRMLLRSHEVQAILIALALGGLVSTRDPWIGLAGVLGAAGWAFVRRRTLIAAALHHSFLACVDVASKAIHGAPPAVVVGSSWGGAIAMELLLRGVWNGPTVLLAPAFSKVDRKTLRGDAEARRDRLKRLSAETPVVIFHDPADDVIPHADSEALACDSGIELRSVDAGGHRLMPLVEGGELGATLRTFAQPSVT